jgi:hypothetical protein
MPKGKRAETRPEPPSEVQSQLATEELPNEVSPANSTRQRPERPERPDRSDASNRLSLQLNDDGSIAWDRLRESNRERTEKLLAQWLNDPKLAEKLGVKKPIVEIFSAEYAGSIYDVVGKVEAMLAPRITGMPVHIAQAVFTYTAEEKAMLAGPTAAIINKWAPLWLAKFQEEIQLALLLTTITAAKFQLAKAIFDNERAQQATPVQPIRTNGAEHVPEPNA